MKPKTNAERAAKCRAKTLKDLGRKPCQFTITVDERDHLKKCLEKYREGE